MKPDIVNLVHYLMLKHKSATFEEIQSLLNLESEELLNYITQINMENNQKIPIGFINGKPKIIYHKKTFETHDFDFPKNKLTLMLVSDKHIDHNDDRVKYIEHVYNEASRRGVDYVFDLGDILNGPSSQIHNPDKVLTGTLEGSLSRLIKYHPTNIPTYFITGNHDLKFNKSDMCDIGRLIESEVKNMIFLNNLFAPINIGNLRINLTHGSIENKHINHVKLSKEYKHLSYNDPHIICQGHFHLSGIYDENTPFLYQIPSLKSGIDNYKTNKRNNRVGDEIGAIILVIKELSNEFEIRHERLEFIESTKVTVSEMALKKTL